jgi:hypothetical protein
MKLLILLLFLVTSCSTYKIKKITPDPGPLKKPVNLFVQAQVQSGSHPGCPFDRRVMNKLLQNKLSQVPGITITTLKNNADKVITVSLGCGYEGDFNGPSLVGYIITLSLIPAVNDQSVYTSIMIEDNKNRRPAAITKNAQFIRSGLSVFFPTAYLVGDSSYTFQKDISQNITYEIIQNLNN